MVNDSSIITIVYDMLDDFETTREISKQGTMIRPTLLNRQIEIDIVKEKS